jgi:CRP-like cAMP-binding protein
VATELLERRGEQMFPKLTSEQRARLAPHSSARITHADEILLEAGAEPRGVYIVIAGSVEY